jgi:5-methyltetrahydropteroyltriglutamate--homocysteine methyltransferase
MLLPTSLVGSYPQPDWLIDRERLSKDVPRIRANDLWRVDADRLEAAQDDATILAIRDQERAGLTIITDGEQRRESYSNRFATALEGIDIENPGTTLSRIGKPIAVPRVVGPIRRKGAVLVRDLKVLRANTERAVKMTLPGPFTMSKQAQDEFYRDAAKPWRSTLPPRSTPKSAICSPPAPILCSSTSRGCSSIRTTRGVTGSPRSTARSTAVTGTVAVHVCFGYAALVHGKPAGYSFLPELENSRLSKSPSKRRSRGLILKILKTLPSKTIVLGVNDLADLNAETPEIVAARIRAALAVVPAERLAVAPDCGMKYLPRKIAFAKMQALADGAAIVRREIAGG